jgi:hypothetical protein
MATDLEDGDIPDDSLVWTIDGENVGVGSELQIWLVPGLYDVTLSAKDVQGNVGRETVALRVGFRTYLPMVIR